MATGDTITNITQYLYSGERDTDGAYLPPDFYSIPASRVLTWSVDNLFVETIVETNHYGDYIYTRTTTMTNNGVVPTGSTTTQWGKAHV